MEEPLVFRSPEEQAELDDETYRYEKLLQAHSSITHGDLPLRFSFENSSSDEEQVGTKDAAPGPPVHAAPGPPVQTAQMAQLAPPALPVRSVPTAASSAALATKDKVDNARGPSDADATNEGTPPESDGNAKKILSLRDMRKQAAAVTGIHGFGKKAHAAQKATTAKAKESAAKAKEIAGAGLQSLQEKAKESAAKAFKKSGGVEGSEAARKATAVVGTGGSGSGMYLDAGQVVAAEQELGADKGRSSHTEDLERISQVALTMAKRGRTASLVSWLQQHGDLSPDAVKRVDGWTLAHAAAEGGKCEVLAWAIRFNEPRDGPDGIEAGGGVSPSAVTTQGWTPAHIAAAHGHTDAIELLSDLGADLEAPDESGARPMHSAAASGHCGGHPRRVLCCIDSTFLGFADALLRLLAAACTDVINVLALHGCALNPITHEGASAVYVAAGNG